MMSRGLMYVIVYVWLGTAAVALVRYAWLLERTSVYDLARRHELATWAFWAAVAVGLGAVALVRLG